ncbi:MAG TPA: hypothetical protein PLH56_06775 [Candidatus Omnitrophota bacterium]|nr:hypothetical protein [Candidatus Omnitrophota bacterium]
MPLELNYMPQCIFIQNNLFFRFFIKKHLLFKKKNVYFLLGSISSSDAEFLKLNNIQEMDFGFDEKDREIFMKEYISAIGKVGSFQNNLLWWATDVASKNRFTSYVEPILEKFWIGCHLINLQQHDCLFLINTPWPIEHCLRRLLKQESLFYQIKEFFLFIYYIGKAFLYKLCYSLWIGIKIIINIYQARIVLGKKFQEFLKLKQNYKVIKSFILKSSFSPEGLYQDNYFGPLPEFFFSKNSTLILAVVIKDFKECLQQIKNSSSEISIFPLECFLTLRDVVYYAWRYFCYWPRIREKILFNQVDISDIFNKELLRSSFKIQFLQLLHYPAVKKMLKQIFVKTFVMTCENNPWERMCVYAIREAGPLTKVIGYSHNVIPQASCNMFISEEEKNISPLPDKILTTGQEPKAIMEYYGNFHPDFIEVSCGLRFQYLFNKPLCARRGVRNILLALEGIEDVRHLIDYALAQILGSSQYFLTIRTHPVLPWRYFVKKYKYDLTEARNIVISDKKSLYEDIENSDAVLYWGTTVALEGLSMGKPVIHFDNGSLLSYDPLFRCPFFKWNVSAKDDLKKTLEEIDSLSGDDYNILRLKAKEYLEKYFTEITEERLNLFNVS